jgi:X-X-X-Leu-X-X-Gly heptad repeat protein
MKTRLSSKPAVTATTNHDAAHAAGRRANRIAKPAACCALSLVLASGLMLPVASPNTAYAADSNAAAEKDEVVYVKADANAAVQGIYVVNIFDLDTNAQVKDPANYKSVINLSTTQALEQKNGEVEVSTTANEPFYYQGILDANTQLPWTIKLTYYLDGKEIAPENLAGASGQLKVVLDVSPVETGDVSDFSTSYLLQAQGTFAEDAFTITDGGGATIAHSGSDQVATCLVLPGEEATFEISGTAHDFNYEGWQIACMPLSLSIDIASQDTSELTSKTKELEDGTSKLSSGASEISSASAQIEDGAQSLAAGTNELANGVESAASGLGQLSASSSSLTGGWNKVSAGIKAAISAINQLKAGSDSFQQGIEAKAGEYASAAAQLASAQAAYAQAAQNAQAAIASGDSATIAQAVAQMNACAQTLAQVSAASGAYGALSGVLDSYSDLGNGITTLANSTEALGSGVDSFGEGLSTYTSGVNTASKGTVQLQAGTTQLQEGANTLSNATSQLSSGTKTLATSTKTLADSVRGLDQKILDELQNTIDEKLGKDFQAHSYVVPSNTNVNAVQFVYVVEGISEPEDSADDTSSNSEENQTFLDRLVALFTSQE